MASQSAQPTCYIIAGPNGVGKTTFAQRFLPRYSGTREFVNADLIAQGLSPLNPEGAAIQAGRLMLTRLQDLAEKRVDFAFETTLSGKGYLRVLRSMKAQGYSIHLYFLWTTDVELTRLRIVQRVRKGGHDIPDEIVDRRYRKCIANFFLHYRPLADAWRLFDSSGREPRQIAFEEGGELTIIDGKLYGQLLEEVSP